MALPSGLQYALWDYDAHPLGFTFTHDTFLVSTTPLIAHTLCGDLAYRAYFEGPTVLSTLTRPMAYDETALQFELYSEDETLEGFRKVELEAYFVEHPLGKSVDPKASTLIEILDPCLSPAGITAPPQDDPPVYFYRPEGV